MIRSVQNQYRGINAHLHSLWQAEGKWHHFHNVYIAGLMQALNAQLRQMNYVAEIEDALLPTKARIKTPAIINAND